jgi:uncharacterized membrane protein
MREMDWTEDNRVLEGRFWDAPWPGHVGGLVLLRFANRKRTFWSKLSEDMIFCGFVTFVTGMICDGMVFEDRLIHQNIDSEVVNS